MIISLTEDSNIFPVMCVIDVSEYTTNVLKLWLGLQINPINFKKLQTTLIVTSSYRINYSNQTNFKKKNGCSEITPLSCGASENLSFLELIDTTYDLESNDPEKCKQACLLNCSSKAAIFHYGLNSSVGKCYLPSEIFSLKRIWQAMESL